MKSKHPCDIIACDQTLLANFVLLLCTSVVLSNACSVNLR